MYSDISIKTIVKIIVLSSEYNSPHSALCTITIVKTVRDDIRAVSPQSNQISGRPGVGNSSLSSSPPAEKTTRYTAP